MNYLSEKCNARLQTLAKDQYKLKTGEKFIIIIIIINPLTTRVVGAPQMILQPVFSIFPCSPLPSGTCQTPGLSTPWCSLPPSSFVLFFRVRNCDNFTDKWHVWWKNLHSNSSSSRLQAFAIDLYCLLASFNLKQVKTSTDPQWDKAK